MSDRNLTTTVRQVFGDVNKGTECRVCGRNVTDGRAKYCSDYCSNIASAVMQLLNWSSVRRRIIDRDDETCLECGLDMARIKRANDHIRERIDENLGERPSPGPGLAEIGKMDDYDWDEYYERVEEWQERRDELLEQYGNPWERDIRLEVDHITPVSQGGHPFDPANLQTLCEECHQQKTSQEAQDRAERRTPSAQDLNESLFEYVETGGDEALPPGGVQTDG